MPNSSQSTPKVHLAVAETDIYIFRESNISMFFLKQRNCDETLLGKTAYLANHIKNFILLHKGHRPTNRYTRPQNLAWSHSVLIQTSLCKKPLFMSSIANTKCLLSQFIPPTLTLNLIGKSDHLLPKKIV